MPEQFPKTLERKDELKYHYNQVHAIITNNEEIKAQSTKADDNQINQSKLDFNSEYNIKFREEAMNSQEVWSVGILKNNQKEFEKLQKIVEQRNVENIISKEIGPIDKSTDLIGDNDKNDDNTMTTSDLCIQIARLYWQIAVQILRKEVKIEAAKVSTSVPHSKVSFGQLQVRYLPDPQKGLTGSIYDTWLSDEEIKIEKVPVAADSDEVGKRRVDKQHTKIIMLAKQKVSAYFFGVKEGVGEVTRLAVAKFGDKIKKMKNSRVA
jgi:hypothetical protein